MNTHTVLAAASIMVYRELEAMLQGGRYDDVCWVGAMLVRMC